MTFYLNKSLKTHKNRQKQMTRIKQHISVSVIIFNVFEKLQLLTCYQLNNLNLKL